MHMPDPTFLSRLSSGRLSGLRSHVKAGLVVAVLVAVGTLFVPDYYKSQASILPVDTSGGGSLGGLASIGAAFGVSLGGGQGDANFPDILDSRWLKERLLQTEFHFHTRFGRFGSDQARQETLYAFLEAPNMDKAVAKLGKIYAVNRDLKTNIIDINVETRSPELSQQVAQKATGLLEEYVQHMSRTRSGERAAFAEERLVEARHEMDQAEESLRKFLDINRNYQSSNDPSIRLHGDSLERELKLRQDLVTTLATNREQALLDAKNDVPVLNILDSGNLPLEKSWPSRTLLVLMAFLVTVGGLWGWENRAWIRANILDGTGGAG